MKKINLFLLLGLFLTTQPAYAYLDPGAGSFLWQMLIGLGLGATFMLKTYLRKAKTSFKDHNHNGNK